MWNLISTHPIIESHKSTNKNENNKILNHHFGLKTFKSKTRSRIKGRVDKTELESWIWINKFSRASMLYLDPWIRWRSTPPLMEENKTRIGEREREERKVFIPKSEKMIQILKEALFNFSSFLFIATIN